MTGKRADITTHRVAGLTISAGLCHTGARRASTDPGAGILAIRIPAVRVQILLMSGTDMGRGPNCQRGPQVVPPAAAVHKTHRGTQGGASQRRPGARLRRPRARARARARTVARARARTVARTVARASERRLQGLHVHLQRVPPHGPRGGGPSVLIGSVGIIGSIGMDGMLAMIGNRNGGSGGYEKNKKRHMYIYIWTYMDIYIYI